MKQRDYRALHDLFYEFLSNFSRPKTNYMKGFIPLKVKQQSLGYALDLYMPTR